MKPQATRILAAVVFFAALSTAGCLSSGGSRKAAGYARGFMPGVYEGSGRGYRGLILVRVQTGLAGIEDIAIAAHREFAFPGVAAMEELLEAVLEFGSTDLDVVSGATFSSKGFLEAVDDALKRAVQDNLEQE
ncbi:MAG: FMN-binding protein [Treponema sp.]|nr:FMN-binding protein [Treponema sp.]